MNLKKMKPKSNSMMSQDDFIDDDLFLENDFGTQFPEKLSPDILELLDEDY
jgi:hypothetical protein